MKNKLLSILRDSRSYLIVGGVILVISVFGIAMTSSPSALEVYYQLNMYVSDTGKLYFALHEQRMLRLSISIAGLVLGSLMFIYGLAMQSSRSKSW